MATSPIPPHVSSRRTPTSDIGTPNRGGSIPKATKRAIRKVTGTMNSWDSRYDAVIRRSGADAIRDHHELSSPPMTTIGSPARGSP